jgi:hypothetical protein
MYKEQLNVGWVPTYVDEKGREFNVITDNNTSIGGETVITTSFIMVDYGKDAPDAIGQQYEHLFYKAKLHMLSTGTYSLDVSYPHANHWSGVAYRYQKHERIEDAIAAFVSILKRKLPREIASKWAESLFK